MIRFLLKGILRDKNRSILPIIVVTIGVALTVFLSGYLKGVMTDMIDQTANFDTGHVKVMSHAFAENESQLPNDLALLGVGELTEQLEQNYPELHWNKRIRFGGLLDIPGPDGESLGQGPVTGLAMEIDDAEERARYNLDNALVSGELPYESNQVVLSQRFADDIGVSLGDDVTFFGTTMEGSMSFKNIQVSGTVKFGTPMLDKGAMIVNIEAAQSVLDMEDGASEIVGYFKNGAYLDDQSLTIEEKFNNQYDYADDKYAPQMFALRNQNGLSTMLDMVDYFSFIFVGIFVIAMSVVLWNTGLLGVLRRYQEFGIRLALGESKGAIYRSLFFEAVLIGFIGSVIGTLLGLAGVWYLQKYGIDISGMLEDITMLMPTKIRAKFSPSLLFIGFIPGLFAMVLGNLLSGSAIYRRETSSLFKELEV